MCLSHFNNQLKCTYYSNRASNTFSLSQVYRFTFLFFLCFLCCWPFNGFQLACVLWSGIWQDLEEYFVVRGLFSISCSDWLVKLTGLVMEQFANSVFLSRVLSNAANRAWDARGGCIPDTLLSDCLKESFFAETAIYQIVCGCNNNAAQRR